MKKNLLVIALAIMVCECANAISFSKHNANAYVNAYSNEEINIFSQHLKELKASKQFKSVSLMYPCTNTELYYIVTNADGKKGLLYSTISSQNSIKDTLLVPMKYYGFAIMPRTTREEPYLAYNYQKIFSRQMYFNHQHEETVIFASITPRINQWDIYSAYHLSDDYKSGMVCDQILSNIQESSLSYVMGLIVLNAKVYCSNDEDYLFILSETDNACLYTAAGQPICTTDQNISTIALYTERSIPRRLTRVVYISKYKTSGAGYLNQWDPWMPPIFASVTFAQTGALMVKCNETSVWEVYRCYKDYRPFIQKSNSPIATYYKNSDYENGIKYFCEIPKSQQTADDIFYAAKCCESVLNGDFALIESINGLLAHKADMETSDLPNIEKMQYFMQLGKQLFTDARAKDASLSTPCQAGINNITQKEQQLPAMLKEYEEHDLTRSAIYESQSQQAEFWGNLIGGVLSSALNTTMNTSASNNKTNVSSTSTAVTAPTSNSTSYESSSNESSANELDRYHQENQGKAKNRIRELEQRIHTYEGLLKDAKEFQAKCEAEHSPLLRQAISDVKSHEHTIQECQNEINKLKAEYQL